MNRKNNEGVYLLLGLVLSLAAGGGHLVYPSGPYTGRVLDAETTQPIAGAAVIAIWTREIPVGAHMPEQDWDAYETLSDANGEFTIPRRTHFTLIGWIEEPTLVAYFSAFAPGFLGDGDRRNQGPPGTSLMIRLKRLTTREERVHYADRPVGTLMLSWDKIPNLMRLINEEAQRLGLQPYRRPRSAP
jgi:hypothetical protein